MAGERIGRLRMENANRLRVSVIVPVFNAADSLPVTIDSVLKQTLTDLELILVNDGSGDASLDICERYAKNDDRIVVIDQENGGVSRARNTGLEAARGEYISFLDADDELVSDFLQEAVQDCDENQLDVWLGTTIRVAEGRECGRNEPWENIECYGDELTEKQIIMLFNSAACVSSKLYRKKAIASVRFREDLNWGEDLFFAFSIMEKHVKIFAKRKIVYKYNWSGKGLASSVSSKRCTSMVEVYRYLFNNIKLRRFEERGMYFDMIKDRWLGDLNYIENWIVRSKVPLKEKKDLFRMVLADENLKTIAEDDSILNVSFGLKAGRCLADDVCFVLKKDGIPGIWKRVIRRLR